MNAKAMNRKIRLKNCSSWYWADPTGTWPSPPSPKLKFVAKKPKGKAPIPKDIWDNFIKLFLPY